MNMFKIECTMLFNVIITLGVHTRHCIWKISLSLHRPPVYEVYLTPKTLLKLFSVYFIVYFKIKGLNLPKLNPKVTEMQKSAQCASINYLDLAHYDLLKTVWLVIKLGRTRTSLFCKLNSIRKLNSVAAGLEGQCFGLRRLCAITRWIQLYFVGYF